MVALRWDLPANGGHDDLFLRLGGWVHRCDSYYFALEAENGVRVNAGAVAKVMQVLLRQWRDCVRQLVDGAFVYLPYDFSDQSTAWLQVERMGTQLEVTAGWSSQEGYAFLPSESSGVQPIDWRKIADAPVVTTTVEAWDRAIMHSSAELERITA